MTGRTPRRAAGPPATLHFLFLLLLLPVIPGPLAGQVRDTTQVRDTLAADTVVADTVPPAPLVPLRPPRPAGFATGVWRWDRDALIRSRAVSLAQLLADITGVTTLRTGLYLQPEAASPLGSTAGGLAVEIDGWAVDPMTAPSFDLTRFPLAQIDELTVTRGLDGVLRIEIRTLEAFDPRAYSRVEAATGEPNANVFRGLLVAPRFLVGPIGFAVERVDTDGLGAAEPADDFGVWIKYGWTRENRGVQVEFSQLTMQRESESPWISKYSRRDVVLRARNRFLPGLVGEAYAGFVRLEDEGPEPPEVVIPFLPAGATERSAFQGGARLGLALAGGSMEAAVRARDRADLPSLSGSLDAMFAPFGERATVRGRFDHERWDGASASRIDVAAAAGVLPWLRVFAGLGNGTQAAPAWGRPGDGPVLTDRTAWRAGAEIAWRGATVAAAALSVDTDSVAAFGLPFDSTFRRFPGGDVRGFEVQGRVPILGTWLSLDGSYVGWQQGTRWAYLPAASGSAGLQIHWLPLASGNLEILVRGEAAHRGEMAVPDTAAAATAFLTTVPARTVFNGDLILRIIDVQAFLRWEDMSNQDPFDVPGRVIRGPRILYGVKWHFWN